MSTDPSNNDVPVLLQCDVLKTKYLVSTLMIRKWPMKGYRQGNKNGLKLKEGNIEFLQAISKIWF
jgi:hypothetical protein